MELPKKKGLGRGLGALIPPSPVTQEAPPVPDTSVPIESIRANPWQPRSTFDEGAIQELAESVREQGIVQPLLVRRRGDGYELIAGERRLRAAKAAGLSEVPVVVRELGDREAFEAALVENLQREDLSALEEAAAYQRLMEEFGLTQEEVAGRVGRSRPAVANTLRLLHLPDGVRREVEKGRLSAGHARALLAIDRPEEQAALARETIRLGLSVRALENRIRVRGKSTARPVRDVHVEDAERQLMRSLGTKVRILSRGKRGRIVVEYYSPAELDGLIAKLRG
ncbi:MAG: ParB family transcriptional regulator, chromosome partitioning protein [Candidatus Binatota bacterium]|jgi:ParB family chromosome partitioning protein|nr:ParB family transcriptional regulator, chromosome partitioning protein [Candidatus Binatota bacterium]